MKNKAKLIAVLVAAMILATACSENKTETTTPSESTTVSTTAASDDTTTKPATSGALSSDNATSDTNTTSTESAADTVTDKTTSASTDAAKNTSKTDAKPVTEKTTAKKTETTTAKPTIPNNNYITKTVAGQTSAGCYTYEGAKGVWAHLVNPYNQLSLFNPTQSSDFPEGTKSIKICFTVSGVKDKISAFCGLSAYGVSDFDDELSVWDNDTYKELTGEDYSFIIDKDGYYEMEVPIAKMAEGLDFWEGLSYAYIMEVSLDGAQAKDSAGEYIDALYDGLSFEFLGIMAV